MAKITESQIRMELLRDVTEGAPGAWAARPPTLDEQVRRIACLVNGVKDGAYMDTTFGDPGVVVSPPLSKREYAVNGSEDAERFNELQRARREGWKAATLYYDPGWERDTLHAAVRYPLKVRSHRSVPDPHGDGEWTTDVQENAMSGYTYVTWRPVSPDDGPLGTMQFTNERIAVMQGLLAEPWEWVDDTEPENG